MCTLAQVMRRRQERLQASWHERRRMGKCRAVTRCSKPTGEPETCLANHVRDERLVLSFGYLYAAARQQRNHLQAHVPPRPEFLQGG